MIYLQIPPQRKVSAAGKRLLAAITKAGGLEHYDGPLCYTSDHLGTVLTVSCSTDPEYPELYAELLSLVGEEDAQTLFPYLAAGGLVIEPLGSCYSGAVDRLAEAQRKATQPLPWAKDKTRRPRAKRPVATPGDPLAELGDGGPVTI